MRHLIVGILLLSAVAVCAGCKKATPDASVAASVVTEFAAQHDGKLLDGGEGRSPGVSERRWYIVIPATSIKRQAMQELAKALLEGIGKEDASLLGYESSDADRTICERESGEFLPCSGPAFVVEVESCGDKGYCRILAKGLYKKHEKRMGYYVIPAESPMPEGEKAMLFDVHVIKWK